MASDYEVRKFSTGATRDTDVRKLKYRDFFSAAVLKRRAEYMDKHRVQPDGALREANNWKKGIPEEAYSDSLIRHVQEYAQIVTNEFDGDVQPGQLEELLCAIMFNAEGHLFEILKAKQNGKKP